VVAPRAPLRGDGGQRSCLTIRQSPWVTAIMPSWQPHVIVLRDRGSDPQNRRLVRVRKRAHRRRHQATVAWCTSMGNLAFVESNYKPIFILY